ncbi:MAG: hypothetical protein KatS3mg103_1031 [Phycisphaerales bacterium]|nr:MAG: hypothetical protein KatS3mg103_1031 [Phycisphaerales bacterium]
MTMHATKNAAGKAPNRASASACLAAGMLAAVGVPTPAALAQHDYEVTHEFDVNTRGNLPPRLSLKHREYAYARCGRSKSKKNNLAIDVLGLGVNLFTETAIAGTVSSANSEADVTTLVVGNAQGEIKVFGDVDLCPPGVARSAYGRAFSAARLYYRGQGMDRRGRIGWGGGWRAEPGIQGGIGKVRRIDPIIGRVFDRTTGTMTEHLILDIENFVQDGRFAWENNQVSNTARTMELRMVMPGDVTTERGRLVVRCEDGEVVFSEATGVYASVAVPPVGASSTFTFDLENLTEIEYDMPGDDDHELDVELEMGGAGEHEEVNGALAGDVYITTDLDGGKDLAPVYVVPDGAPLGVPLIPGEITIAQPFDVRDGQRWQLDQAVVRLIQHDCDGSDLPLERVVVRLWEGQPGAGGRIIAGDLDTNRLLDSTFTGIQAVQEHDRGNDCDDVADGDVDLSWLPPLEPGRYYLELSAVGSSSEPVLLPPSPFPATVAWQPALVGFGPGQYEPLIGHDGQLASAPILLLGQDIGGTSCPPDLDGDGELTIFDFLQFQNLFAAGDMRADFDGDGELTLFDFLAYQNAFAAGCP